MAQNVYAWPADSVTIPAVVVGYPTRVVFDLTYQRGGDTFNLPVWLVVGKTGSVASRDAMSTALTGAVSIKDGLDGHHDFGDVRCTDAVIEEITIAAVSYVGIRFDCEVI